MHVQILLFQAIKDVPIYGKAIYEACLKNLGRKKKDPTTIHIVGQLVDITLGILVIPKYYDPRSLVMNVIINGRSIKNALIDLGVAINIMTKDTIKKLNIEGLMATPKIMQHADSSIVTLNGMIEDIEVILDSLEYPVDFMILSPKVNLSGYPVILG